MTTSDTGGQGRAVPMRLQKFLARAGVASRRGSEDLMTAGRVTVNGQTVTELGSRVDPSCDEVCVDGRPVHLADGPFTIVLHKPSGYLTTMRDPRGRPCVASLVPTGEHPGLFPVGRLDADTTGLLLFTTDGDLGQALAHPSAEKPKDYVALVEGEVRPRELEPLHDGIELDDGPCAPARGHVLSPRSSRVAAVAPHGVPEGMSVVALTIHEGRKHQVKRMLAAIGHPVARLHRDGFGPVRLGDLAEGAWRPLASEELQALEAVKAEARHERQTRPHPLSGADSGADKSRP